jgi:glycosyltransferase involved in cell wall biosynthesis
VGGAQTRFAAIANHLGSEARHIVVSLDGRLDAREKLDPGLTVSFPAIRTYTGKRGALLGAGAAIVFLRRSLADRLVTSNWGSMDWALANRFVGLPHLHTEDGFGPEEQDRQLRRRAWTRAAVLRRCDVMLPSHTLRRIAEQEWRLPPARLHYVPNGIDTAAFAGAMPIDPARLAALGDGPVFGTIAALRPEKNVARLIGAFAALRRQRPARLVIVGDGAERPALERLAAELSVSQHVLFAGHSAEAARWMASFDVFALSSDTEQMPLSVLEAMAAGLPVVSTDVGDVRHMVSPQNLPLIVARDIGALASAMAQAVACGSGEANRARARALYDHESMFARYRQLWGVEL